MNGPRDVLDAIERADLPDLDLLSPDAVRAELAQLPGLSGLAPKRRRWRKVLLLAVLGAAVAWFVRQRSAGDAPLDAGYRPVTPPPAPGRPAAFTSTPVDVTAAAAPGAHAGSAQPLADGAAPGPEFVIKGNEDSMIFHTPESPSYERTVAEVWFRTEADAVAAGFRAPRSQARKAEDD